MKTIFAIIMLASTLVWAQADELNTPPAAPNSNAATETVNQPADGAMAHPTETQKKTVKHAAKKAKKAKKHKKSKKAHHKKKSSENN